MRFYVQPSAYDALSSKLCLAWWATAMILPILSHTPIFPEAVRSSPLDILWTIGKNTPHLFGQSFTTYLTLRITSNGSPVGWCFCSACLVNAHSIFIFHQEFEGRF